MANKELVLERAVKGGQEMTGESCCSVLGAEETTGHWILEALAPHLKGTGIECEARPCLPAAFPQPEPHCHRGLGEGTVQLAPSSRPTSQRLLESRHHRLLLSSAELTHRLAPAGHMPDLWHHRRRTRVAPGRRGHRGEPRNDATSLHLKRNKKTPKRRTDLCNYRLALQIARTRSGARLGRQ